MSAIAIHHASVLVQDLDRARVFFETILGLKVNVDRPSKAFDGLWYDVGPQQIHLIVSEQRDLSDETSLYPGARRHVALLVDSIDEMGQRIREHGLPLFESRSGRPVLFCRDFDGNAFELIDVASLD